MSVKPSPVPHIGKTPVRLARQKLSDLVVDQVKGWLMNASIRPGDRLPQERELMMRFGVSKGTIREALKALEVQGIIQLSTGPSGGATVKEVSYETAADLLGNYFYFQDLDAEKIYHLRRALEPLMAESVVGHLREDDFERLARLAASSSVEHEEPEARRKQRLDELEFHNVLADRCPNSLLSFYCKFINRLLADRVVYKRMYLVEKRQIACENHAAHTELLEAYRRHDRGAVRLIMQQHMDACSAHVMHLEAVVEARFFRRRAQGE